MLLILFSFSDFSNETVEQDLSALIGEDNLNLHPAILKLPIAMKAANVLITVAPFSSIFTPRISISVMALS